ncbi:MAG: M48 family metallopeptidase [Actinomycetota bacterium]|nr:M48 family metallopeptidase [Actinomycetota bacterium]
MSPAGLSTDAFKLEVQDWAERIGVSPSEIHVRDMARKWGSCSSTGRVTFSRDLLEQPEAARAEVIVHELVHLKVPNHGPLFRGLERAYIRGGTNTLER